MKRRVLAVIILCLGIVGLLWEYTLYEGENYRITQTAFGGKMTVFHYDAVFSLPAPDNIVSGVSGRNLDEVVNKVLSGNISWNEMYFTAREPEMRFGGLLGMHTPTLPEGCFLNEKRISNVFWNTTECTFYFSGALSGTISYCEENCAVCKRYDEQWDRVIDEGRTDVQLCDINGARVMDSNGLSLWGEDNGVGYHAVVYCDLRYVTKEQLSQFGMKNYYPKHPKLLAVGILQFLSILLVLTGGGMLLHSVIGAKKRGSGT